MLGWNHGTPRLIWAFTATVGEAANKRTPTTGKNPFNVNPYYTAALFQLRCTDISGLITVNRVLLYGSLTSNGFGAPGLGFADQHVLVRWAGGVNLNQGQLRQPKLVDGTTVPITRRGVVELPPWLLLEWNTNAAGDPGATKSFELWAMFSGPAIAGAA